MLPLFFFKVNGKILFEHQEMDIKVPRIRNLEGQSFLKVQTFKGLCIKYSIISEDRIRTNVIVLTVIQNLGGTSLVSFIALIHKIMISSSPELKKKSTTIMLICQKLLDKYAFQQYFKSVNAICC